MHDQLNPRTDEPESSSAITGFAAKVSRYFLDFLETDFNRCDFLLCYQNPDGTINVILEYDGFQEHFTDHKQIHLGNYDGYYRSEEAYKRW